MYIVYIHVYINVLECDMLLIIIYNILLYIINIIMCNEIFSHKKKAIWYNMDET